MAEIVEGRMESMTEIQEMRRLKLFSIIETKDIIKKRKAFECKLNGVEKNLQHFKDYINYELSLLKDIKLRRKKLKISENKDKIEIRILNNIKSRYEIALQRFTNEMNFHLEYFKFCREYNFHQAACLCVQNMIKAYAHVPDIWLAAAAYYVSRDTKQSLALIHKGIAIHPSSQALQLEAIQLELLQRQENQYPSDTQCDTLDDAYYKKIEQYIDAVEKNIHDHACLISILNILDPHNFTEKIQHRIIELLMSKYSNEPDVWHFLAEREQNGKHYPVPDELRTSTKFKLQRLIDKYELGLRKISIEKKVALWTYYLDFLIELNELKDISNHMIKSTLKEKLQDAKRDSVLNERYYLTWAKLYTEESDILRIIEDGLAALPNSLALWKKKLICMTMRDDVKALNVEFKKGHMALKENSTPLWIILIKYHLLNSPEKVVETIYRDACHQHGSIANEFKGDFVEWAALNKGIEDTRKVYQDLAFRSPFCKDLHIKMAKLEETELIVSAKDMEHPLNLLCKQFGKDDPDCWIALRDCYLNHQTLFENAYPAFNINTKLAQIRTEALKSIGDSGPTKAEFLAKYDTASFSS
ncbi:U3 small nucleolar RNA-associated protein 6 homolog [Diabrotica virgifera virgifera]|uniref:U3 small nucleolar RNA-associated protein 6 homolog n=1 Tax=Diabrotica virgifera virgifera TaxID=50390 RepID=A0A6P7FNT8_DIAVI|nr:U3 small nucleolar RNA-associated protein 6 homolog [Diabrotica virgifera virgifera]